MTRVDNEDLESFILRRLEGDQTEQCIARLAATGAVQRFHEFLTAEINRGTEPRDLLLAVSSVQGGMLSATMMLCFKRETKLAAADLLLDQFCKAIRANLIDDHKVTR